MPWQQHSMKVFLFSSRYITDAKFQLHYSNISRDILDFDIWLHL